MDVEEDELDKVLGVNEVLPRKISEQIQIDKDVIIRQNEKPRELAGLKTHQDWTHDQRARKVEGSESIFNTLRKINPNLVSKPHRPNDNTWLKKSVIYFTPFGKHVPYGYISIGECYGNPKIFQKVIIIMPVMDVNLVHWKN